MPLDIVYKDFWKLRQDDFVGPFEVFDIDLEDVERSYGKYILEQDGNLAFSTLKPVPERDGLFFIETKGSRENVVLLKLDTSDDDFYIVGGYVDEILWVDGGSNGSFGVRGQGLAAELVLEKMSKVGIPFNVIHYTSAGIAAHEAAHRLAVRRALEAGKDVPGRVMQDYPEMAAQNAPRP